MPSLVVVGGSVGRYGHFCPSAFPLDPTRLLDVDGGDRRSRSVPGREPTG